jgi:hypothetical protein
MFIPTRKDGGWDKRTSAYKELFSILGPIVLAMLALYLPRSGNTLLSVLSSPLVLLLLIVSIICIVECIGGIAGDNKVLGIIFFLPSLVLLVISAVAVYNIFVSFGWIRINIERAPELTTSHIHRRIDLRNAEYDGEPILFSGGSNVSNIVITGYEAILVNRRNMLSIDYTFDIMYVDEDKRTTIYSSQGSGIWYYNWIIGGGDGLTAPHGWIHMRNDYTILNAHEIPIFNAWEITTVIPYDGVIDFRDFNLTDEEWAHLVNKVENPQEVTTLLLENNNISDLTKLTIFTELTDLNLRNNNISDLEPLESLANLQSLNLADNQINDITPLGSMVELIGLNLSENQIIDITPLHLLTNLEKLDLSGNHISDIAPIGVLGENRHRESSWWSRTIRGIALRTGLYLGEIGLMELNLNDNNIGDFTPLKSVPMLLRVNIGGNPGVYDDEQMRRLEEALPSHSISTWSRRNTSDTVPDEEAAPESAPVEEPTPEMP